MKKINVILVSLFVTLSSSKISFAEEPFNFSAVRVPKIKRLTPEQIENFKKAAEKLSSEKPAETTKSLFSDTEKALEDSYSGELKKLKEDEEQYSKSSSDSKKQGILDQLDSIKDKLSRCHCAI